MMSVSHEARRTAVHLTSVGLLIFASLGLYGCASQQADLKQTEREFQRRIQAYVEESAQTRARLSQEITSIRERDIPSLRGDVDKTIHRTQRLEARQDDLMVKFQQYGAATSTTNTNSIQANSNQVANSLGLEKCEARLDQHDELVSTIHQQVQQLFRILKEMKGRAEMGQLQ